MNADRIAVDAAGGLVGLGLAGSASGVLPNPVGYNRVYVQIDGALTKFGLAMGPFTMYDMAGMDIGYAIRQRRYVEKPHITYSRIADRVVERGRLGQKTGKGWYRYELPNRKPIPDPEVERIIADYRKEIGVKPRPISDQEIVAMLQEKGINIARRTVAKYRSELGILPSNLRKVY